jgi:hypothetical protein
MRIVLAGAKDNVERAAASTSGLLHKAAAAIPWAGHEQGRENGNVGR